MSVYQSVSIQEIPTLDALRDCVEKSDAVGFGHTLKTAMKESGHPRGWARDLLFDIACSKAETQLRDEMVSMLLRCSKAPRPTRKDNILDIVIGMGHSRATTTKFLFEAGYGLIESEKSIKEVVRHLARGNWYSPDLLCPKALGDPLYCSVFREALSGAGFNPRYYENGSGFSRASFIEKFLEWTARELSIDGHSHLSSLFDGVFLEVAQDPYAFSLNPGTPPSPPSRLV